MDADSATRLARRLDPLHALTYFAPEMGTVLGELGITHPRAQYFAQRSAAMGAVGPGVVAATFFNFNPALIARFVPAVWGTASPGDVLNARLRGADDALRRLLADAATGREVERAGVLARRATEACTPEDRPLYAAHADLPWPDEPHLVLWHAITLLREHRGDAHLHALLGGDLSGIEALVLHTATGRGFLVAFAQASRGWSPEQWGAAEKSLITRGLVDADGAITEAGLATREAIEVETSRLSLAPFASLGDEAAGELADLAGGLSRTVLGNGAFPDGVFAAR